MIIPLSKVPIVKKRVQILSTLVFVVHLLTLELHSQSIQKSIERKYRIRVGPIIIALMDFHVVERYCFVVRDGSRDEGLEFFLGVYSEILLGWTYL